MFCTEIGIVRRVYRSYGSMAFGEGTVSGAPAPVGGSR